MPFDTSHIDPKLLAEARAERERLVAMMPEPATGELLDRLVGDRFDMRRELIKLAPGEPQQIYALGIETPEGYRLETDAEFRARAMARIRGET